VYLNPLSCPFEFSPIISLISINLWKAFHFLLTLVAHFSIFWVEFFDSIDYFSPDLILKFDFH